MRFGRRVHAKFYKKKKPKNLKFKSVDEMMHEPLRDKSQAGIIRHYFSLEGERKRTRR